MVIPYSYDDCEIGWTDNSPDEGCVRVKSGGGGICGVETKVAKSAICNVNVLGDEIIEYFDINCCTLRKSM